MPTRNRGGRDQHSWGSLDQIEGKKRCAESIKRKVSFADCSFLCGWPHRRQHRLSTQDALIGLGDLHPVEAIAPRPAARLAELPEVFRGANSLLHLARKYCRRHLGISA